MPDEDDDTNQPMIGYNNLLIHDQSACPKCGDLVTFEAGKAWAWCHTQHTPKSCDTKMHHPVLVIYEELKNKDTAHIMRKLNEMYPRERTAQILQSISYHPHLIYRRYRLAAQYALQNRNPEEIVSQAQKMI